jgi:hypothetical protein
MKDNLRKLIRINSDYLIKVMSPPKLSSIDISNLDEALKVKVIDIRENMDLGVYTLGAAKIKFFGDDMPLINIPKLKKTGKLQLRIPRKEEITQSKQSSIKI